MPRKITIMLVFTSVAKKTDAVKISKFLVEKKLAACVTTLPKAESRYVWKNKLCVENEFVLLIKTSESGYAKVETALRAIHPYECPEIIGIKVDKAAPAYQEWLTKNLSF